MKELKIKFIHILSILCCIIFYVVSQFTSLSYLYTTLLKIALFAFAPALYFIFISRTSILEILRIRTDKKHLFLGFALGLGIFFIILLAYFILKSYIDLELISKDLMTSSGVTPVTFPFVALYITFVNSFLEEYFFRGFIFLTLYDKGYKLISYVFSALLFAIYHVAIFKSWFNFSLTLLALLGLFLGGIVFNYINTKTKSISNSWLVHIFADISIMIIGVIMFYL